MTIEPKLYIDGDGVNVNLRNGYTETDDGIYNAINISLLTANKNISAHNLLFRRNSEKIGSKFYKESLSSPVNIQGLKDRESAAKSDLQWLIDDGVLSEVNIRATAPGNSNVNLAIKVKQLNGNYIDFIIIGSGVEYKLVQS